VPESKFSRAEDLFRTMLRELRQRKGITQTQLSERLRLPQSYVSKYETGERRLDFVETLFVCEALEIPIDEFVKEFSARLNRKSKSKRD
jgi:transcriptional regulator with XRE-family HTH domain